MLNLSIIFFIAIALYFVYRNERVYNYRVSILDKVSIAAKEDISKLNYNWRWRYDVYESVTYYEMVYKFWKPLDSFFKDKSFLE